MSKRVARTFDRLGVYILMAPALVVGLAAAVGAAV